MDGIISILKPPGMTSHDVVSFTRRLFAMKKVGHAGTLDPAAAGVLPVFLGRATRLIEYTTHADKRYRAEITFGYETDTGDDTGNITRTGAYQMPDRDHIEAVLLQFEGAISQIPPMYSAIKWQGKKLYELARAGLSAPVPERQISIYKITLLRAENNKMLIDVHCSKGTYIRTLCQDIGRRLGCLATMSFLVRTGVGDFSLDEATTLEEVARLKEAVLLPPDRAIAHLSAVILDVFQAKAFRQGQSIQHHSEQTGLIRVYDSELALLGIGSNEQPGHGIRPLKVLFSGIPSGTD